MTWIRWRWHTWVLWNLAGLKERIGARRPVYACPHLIAGTCDECVADRLTWGY